MSETRRKSPGRAPYGWRYERGQLVPAPAEQAVRWLILHLRREGWTLPAIAEELQRLGIKRNGLRLSVATIHRVAVRGAAAEAEEMTATG